LRCLPHRPDELGPEIPRFDVERLQHRDGQVAAFIDHTEEDVLGADVVVGNVAGALLRKLEGGASPRREAAEGPNPVAGRGWLVGSYWSARAYHRRRWWARGRLTCTGPFARRGRARAMSPRSAREPPATIRPSVTSSPGASAVRSSSHSWSAFACRPRAR